MAILFIIAPVTLWAQGSAPAPTTDTSKIVPPDTIMYIPSLDSTRDLSVSDTVDLEQHLVQNPTTALFKSLAIPGWGQVGNKRYFKAALFAGLEIWFVGEAIHYAGQASDYRKQYDAAVDPFYRNHYHGLYKDRYTRRSKFIWYAGITTFISIFDAYVDAHLSGEQAERNERSRRVTLIPSTPSGPGLTLSLSF
ncbi:MAG: DUF5683 domain-containing protein [Candidatus Zixiibacteriota bacterium]